MDAGESLRTLNLQLANSPGRSAIRRSRARTLSNPSAPAAGEAGAGDSGIVMRRRESSSETSSTNESDDAALEPTKAIIVDVLQRSEAMVGAGASDKAWKSIVK